MEAVRVLRFSGPSSQVGAVLELAERSGVGAREMVERAAADESWIELSIPLACSSGVDGDQVVRSLERSVERLGVDFRLREYVTEVRRKDRVS